MIAFMLDAYGEHAMCLELERVAITVQPRDANVLRAGNEFVEAWDRQASLLAFLLFAANDLDHRIDQNERRITLLGHVNHDDTFVDVDLTRGKTDTRRCIHRLQHVVHETTNLVVYTLNWSRPSA